MADELATQEQDMPVASEGAVSGGASADRKFATFVPKNRPLILAVAGLLVMLGFVSLVWWSARPEYRMLYGNLGEKQAAQVAESLQKQHIPYRLKGGNAIMVPADQLYSARLKLAQAGVTPRNGVGFELFDKSDTFGLSDFAQKVNYQRALQGELARTIEVLPQVSAARVHLVLPKDSAFVENQKKASASVMVQLVGGKRLPRETVHALQNLVASSVPQLDAKTVTVVDSAGELLSSDKEENSMNAGRTIQDAQTRMERRLEARLKGMLEQIVGVGQAVVRVTANLDREQVDQQRQTFNPDEVAVRSQRENTESRTSSAKTAAGVPGIASNTPGAKPQANKQSQGSAEKANHTERVTNYEISSVKEHRIIPSGSLKRLSVAVIVGGHMKKENGKEVFVPRSKQELKSIDSLVRNAVGFNVDRGDSINVQSMPLMDVHSNADSKALADASRKALYFHIASYVLAVLALMLIAWFILRPLSKFLMTQRAPSAPSGSAREEADMAMASAALPEGSMPHLEVQNSAKELVSSDPERAARVLQQWTRESA
ncbi:MAG TPA: flagellar basal-body MS-ring/collar protein FliF [Mariprofundaceae bacterium]|nr:flagellar basal-body MS-ring/collar protein FliF [Mariprofundaceae bacterium]